MRKILLLTLFLFISIGCFSRDIISLKNGRRIEVIVTEITPTLVRYKLSPDSRVYFMYKDDVAGIMYQNGRVETFNKADEQVIDNRGSLNETQGQNQYQSQQSSQFTQSRVDLAQGNYPDVVYLKNGSIIRGIIIEQIPNQSIKIQTADGSIFVYRIDEIEKLAIEQPQVRTRRSLPERGSGLQSGYKGIVEMGYQSGTGNYGMDRFQFNFINGGQIGPYFSLGFGTGLRYYFDSEAALIPFFADFRVNFIDFRVSPYFSLDVGYSFDATNNFEGVGFLLNPTVGASFKISRRSAINVGLGYEMQRMKFLYTIYPNGSHNYYSYDYNNSGAISIVVGISF